MPRYVAILFTVTCLLAPATTQNPGQGLPPAPGRSTPAPKPRGERRVDGSSERAFVTSVKAIMKTLSPEQKKRFNTAIERLVMNELDDINDLHDPKVDHEKIKARVREVLDGKTASEVIASSTRLPKPQKLMKKLREARRRANERATIATLMNLASAQAQLQAMGSIDTDLDGNGEYGFFAELAGAVDLRNEKRTTLERRLRPPMLSASFAKVEGSLVTRSGYHYQIWLPGPKGTPVTEGARGGVGRVAPDSTLAETTWCCYAWPITYGTTGKRAFFVNHVGDVLATDNETSKFSGLKKAPRPNRGLIEKLYAPEAERTSKTATREPAPGIRWLRATQDR